ncbi:tRNA preQ1(34) S-adenosylmethionine ribosyltransferase-isomerase QueA, partial [Candidatus Peregrinibacteria bacterium]|nr:tRNA preQ1(34) S-adenosylmethionine ribosyltransferase-isomerase QueA [Candidatus Peregrinibacteria bacterium]
MKTTEFDYNLPLKFIAQTPVEPRDRCKLMVYDTFNDQVSHKIFSDLQDVLNEGDVLVVNRSSVIPARVLFNINGKEREVFILKNLGKNEYKVLVRPGKFFKTGKKFQLNEKVYGAVKKVLPDGSRIIGFNSNIEKFGRVPLPSYIKNHDVDFAKYQTVYAKEKGSVASPTAGIHFTKSLIKKLKAKGIQFEEVILHVGRGTFQPVKTEKICEHTMHSEYFEITKDTAERLNMAKYENRRIIAVGTTSVRVLETVYSDKKGFIPKTGETDIFIYPKKHKWKAVDAIITNFHLPKSTLIMLVSS